MRQNGLQFLLGRTIVQGNVYAKFWRESKEYYGLLSKTLVLRLCSTLCQALGLLDKQKKRKSEPAKNGGNRLSPVLTRCFAPFIDLFRPLSWSLEQASHAHSDAYRLERLPLSREE